MGSTETSDILEPDGVEHEDRETHETNAQGENPPETSDPETQTITEAEKKVDTALSGSGEAGTCANTTSTHGLANIAPRTSTTVKEQRQVRKRKAAPTPSPGSGSPGPSKRPTPRPVALGLRSKAKQSGHTKRASKRRKREEEASDSADNENVPPGTEDNDFRDPADNPRKRSLRSSQSSNSSQSTPTQPPSSSESLKLAIHRSSKRKRHEVSGASFSSFSERAREAQELPSSLEAPKSNHKKQKSGHA
ncbi:hypothetical protein K402DRAFT_400434 [Aulographum hederae CBS 113979]|uniref:Uncharacterized protein n=1 Tax=Aulographum hederae CBS 113979 TaxID=1176131 RepID=A0A6G1HFB8_9PEZI|nr:hypothetical protein K402DRAFT_400434 [Aulographum hederae CBS 113979]